MNIKEYLINSKNKLLKKKPVDDKVDTVEDDIVIDNTIADNIDDSDFVDNTTVYQNTTNTIN